MRCSSDVCPHHTCFKGIWVCSQRLRPEHHPVKMRRTKSSIEYEAPTDKLYYEYGFGFENIGFGNIRPLRVDFVWRGDHKSINKLPTPKFAIRVGIKVEL